MDRHMPMYSRNLFQYFYDPRVIGTCAAKKTKPGEIYHKWLCPCMHNFRGDFICHKRSPEKGDPRINEVLFWIYGKNMGG